MTEPLTFTSATARFALPFLFAGQAQKELFVNEAHARIDMLLHPSVLGEADDPPAAPADGDCWLVGSAPTGQWSARSGALACRQVGEWQFATPLAGMQLFDRSTRQFLVFTDTWQRLAPPPEPSGGSTVDSEARGAIATLLAALKLAGIFPSA